MIYALRADREGKIESALSYFMSLSWLWFRPKVLHSPGDSLWSFFHYHTPVLNWKSSSIYCVVKTEEGFTPSTAVLV